jgi:microsomal dipeptidase-like Zn-dependent dipeptidase
MLVVSLALLSVGVCAPVTAQIQRPVVAPTPMTTMTGGPCGAHLVNDPNYIALDVRAQATSPFSVAVQVPNGPPGTYSIQAEDVQGQFNITPRPGIAPVAGRPGAAPATFGGFNQSGALPGTQYDYVVRANIGGKLACGAASVTTPLPPVPLPGGQYTAPGQVNLSITLPDNTHEAHLFRGAQVDPATKIWDYAVPGANALAGGMIIPAQVDPGPPPFPYDQSGHYVRAAAVFPFVLQVIWTANPNGTGRSKTVLYPFNIPGPTPILGFADLHSHQMAYLGFGGNPQQYPLGRFFFGKAFGPLDTAMPPCNQLTCGPGGSLDMAEAVMLEAMYGHFPAPANPFRDVGGFPSFAYYPRWNSFTGQAYYESLLHRAFLGGLKLIVLHPVNNAWMCQALKTMSPPAIVATGGLIAISSLSPPGPDCLDDGQAMNQISEIINMQNDIDRRSGGPGTGWYRVVTSPQQARAVIASGKLAVVIGMEIDNPFNCGVNSPACQNGAWIARLNDYYNAGVRHFFPIHFYNNNFGGSANSNALISKSFTNNFTKRNCANEAGQGIAGQYGYEYDSKQCNAIGLTAEGRRLVLELMQRGVIIDIDHMSSCSFNDTLALTTPALYPVVSSHSGFTAIAQGDEDNEGNRTPAQLAKMLKVGGMVTVITHQGNRSEILQYPPGSNIPSSCSNSSQTVAQAYRYAVQKTGGAPVAFGTDLNGFAGWPSPRFGSESCMGDTNPSYTGVPLAYPFTIIATGVRIVSTSLDPGPTPTTTGVAYPSMDAVGHSVLGTRKSSSGASGFDFNTDGFAHIGMLPDLIADWETQGMQPTELDPLFFSAEGYIRLWERTTYLSTHSTFNTWPTGIAPVACGVSIVGSGKSSVGKPPIHQN